MWQRLEVDEDETQVYNVKAGGVEIATGMMVVNIL